MSQLQVGFAQVELQAEVGERVTAFFDERIKAAAPLGPEYQRLWRSARAASMGGKRLRPAFVVSTYHAFGGTDDRSAIDVATAFEVLHTAFLLHDDVIDRDTVRRGAPNLQGEFEADALTFGKEPGPARLWGQTAAILAGDLLIHYAQSLVARLVVPDFTRNALLDVLDTSIFVTAAGELSDVAFSLGMRAARPPELIAMTEHKTAAYSFEGPLTAGAILAGAEPGALRILAEFGRLLGVAFQLGDDLLGLFGSSDLTGKSAVSDLREGKETLVISYARSTGEWDVVAESFGNPEVSEQGAQRARDALERCGARAFVEELVVEFSEQARTLAESPLLPPSLTETLSHQARQCVGRMR